MKFPGGVLPHYAPGDFRIPGVTAIRTWDIHVWKELHIEAYHPCAITCGASQFACVIGKVPVLVTMLFRVRCLGKDFPELIMDIGISRYGRADIDTYRRGVDELHLANPFSLNRFHVHRQSLT